MLKVVILRWFIVLHDAMGYCSKKKHNFDELSNPLCSGLLYVDVMQSVLNRILNSYSLLLKLDAFCVDVEN